MGILSLMMFVGLWGWGDEWFGWSDATGHIRLALFASFMFGVICAIKFKD